jgi:inhibitor of KinA sporulation pathway (predicted exonuclease)
MIRNTPYIALDLELNPGPEVPEIIQVGVAIGSIEQAESHWITRSWYVKPLSGTPITQPITDLTGIGQDTIDSLGVDHNTVGRELSDLIRSVPDLFVNPVTWGQGDASELLEEFRTAGVHFPHFGRRIIDVKTFHVLVELANGRSPAGGLRSSMGRHGMMFKGTPHRADVDAFNTLRFFFHFLRRQESFETCRELITQWKR